MQVEHFLTKPYHPLDLLDRIAGEIGTSFCFERDRRKARPTVQTVESPPPIL